MKTRAIIAYAPDAPVLDEIDLPPLGPHDVQLRSVFGAIKHGTEFHILSNTSPFAGKKFDAELRCFVPLNGQPSLFATKEHDFTFSLGNMCVGLVEAVGTEVTSLNVGDRVYGHMPLRETHILPESRLQLLPEGLSPEAAVCIDPAIFGFNTVRDGNVRPGDRVAIMGLGAIGLMAVQSARLASPDALFVSDPVKERRETALRLGADEAFDPASCDVGHEIKKRTKGGVDVAIEISGHYGAMADAIRAAGYCGLVVAGGFMHGDFGKLCLGEEWHVNRLTMRSSMPDWMNPSRDHPLWSTERVTETVTRMLADGRLTHEGVLGPIVPFEEAATAAARAIKDPSYGTKIGVRF